MSTPLSVVIRSPQAAHKMCTRLTVQPIAIDTIVSDGDDDDSLLGQGTGEAGNADANEQSNGAASASSSSFSGVAGFFSLSVVICAIWRGPV